MFVVRCRVENERGKPKAIKQLATVCRAILEGEVQTANADDPRLIYPIFISDEPAVEAPAVRSNICYANRDLN
jgi:hypothetical protein